MVQTDKQQEFELKSSFDIISNILKGLSVDSVVKTSNLIQILKKLVQDNEVVINEPQDLEFAKRRPLTESIVSCFEFFNKYLERQQLLHSEMLYLQHVKSSNDKQLAEFSLQFD